MKNVLLCLALLFALGVDRADAQLWGPILDRTRATDWSAPGVIGGIPNRTNQCGATLPSNTTAAQISAAIATCSQNGGGVVQLGAGTFAMNATIGFTGANGVTPSSNVTLRGMGADQTFLVWNTLNTTMYCISNNGLICMADFVVSAAQCSHGTWQQNRSTWTGPYTAGTTQITVTNVAGNQVPDPVFGGGTNPVNLVANTFIVLDQLNTTADTAHFNAYLPFSGDANGYGHVLDQGGGPQTLPCLGNGGRDEHLQRCLAEYHWVTAVTDNHNGTWTLTIQPGVNYTYFNSDGNNQPQVWWCHDQSQVLHDVGVENLSIENASPQYPNPQLFRGLIQIAGCHNCWVKGVRSIRSSSSHIYVFDSLNVEVRDSYFYANDHPTNCAVGALGIVTYGMDQASAGLVKYENNIFQQLCAPLMAQPCFVCVYGYNFVAGNLPQLDGTTGIAHAFNTNGVNHVAATHMVLEEGNHGIKINVDHGTAHGYGAGLMTFFRNYMTGYQAANPLPGQQGGAVPTPTTAITINGMNRFINVVGNVLGDPLLVPAGYQYQTSPVTGGTAYPESGYIYSIGWSGFETPDDPITYNSLLRWGNYDYVTSTVRWNTSEVPAGQFVPPQTLPASFYLASKPAWFGSLTWPPIGPDVTTGTVDQAHHVSKIPAKDCYDRVMTGPSSGAGGVLTFNANNCYGTASAPTDSTPPAVPTGLQIK
jgi:hypothetical protein